MIDEKLKTQIIDISTDVLVIGTGAVAVKAADGIAGAGYKVIVAGEGKIPVVSPSFESPDVEAFPEAVLKKVAGVTGNFQVTLDQGDKTILKTVGAIVVATDCSYEPLNESYGVELSDKVITQSRLEELVSDNGTGISGNVAFLSGFAQEGNPLTTERVLNSVDAIEDMKGCSTYFYVNNIKVAGLGLERLFTETRGKGSIAIKLDDSPSVNQEGNDLTISFFDPVLGVRVEHTPDFLVVEEKISPSSVNADLAEILRIDSTDSGLLQLDNVHRFPVNSNREGIFIAGSAREVMNEAGALSDVENVVLKIRSLLEDGKKTVPVDMAVVDNGKCTICLTCYRCCPHGAITIEDDKPVMSPLACQGCGICASECPMDAIQIVSFRDDDIKAEVAATVENNKDRSIVAFACQNSASEAGRMATALGLDIPESVHVVEVPCAGKVDLDYILSAFLEGADGVMVLACHEGNCKSERGNTFAKWRVNDLHRRMEEIGLEKERLKFATMASTMGKAFSDLVCEMNETIGGLGQTGLR